MFIIDQRGQGQSDWSLVKDYLSHKPAVCRGTLIISKLLRLRNIIRKLAWWGTPRRREKTKRTKNNGGSGNCSGRNGLRGTGRRPGWRRYRSRTKERRGAVLEILGEFRNGISARDRALVDREALQKGKQAAHCSSIDFYRGPLRWHNGALA